MIELVVIKTTAEQVSLGFIAPLSIRILREELRKLNIPKTSRLGIKMRE